MIIEINPKLAPLFTQLAKGQGMTDEAYATHVIEKYIGGQQRTQTEELLKLLNVEEVADLKISVEAVIEAKQQPEFITPTEELPPELVK